MKGMCGNPGCTECAEEAAVARIVRHEFEQTTRGARVPTPEIVWWRAQMRARDEAARAAARPILFAQALAVAALVGLLISAAGRLTLPAFALTRFGAAGAAFSWPDMASLSAGQSLLPIAGAAACWLVLAPLALYFAFSSD